MRILTQYTRKSCSTYQWIKLNYSESLIKSINTSNKMSDEKTKKSKSRSLVKYTDNPTEIIAILVVSAIGFIVALAWRDAASTAFEEFFPETESTLTPRIWYAVITTVAAIIIIWLAVKYLNQRRGI